MHEFLSIAVESTAFDGDAVHVLELNGREEIGQLFSFQLRVITRRAEPLDVEGLRGQDLTIIFRLVENEVRRIHGMVIAVTEYLEVDTEQRQYDVVIGPRAHRLTLVHTQDIFLDSSWPQAIEEKLKRVGLSDACVLRLQADYPVREYIVQHNETDLAFVSRLAEHVGISFFFEHSEAGDTIVFTDHNEGFASHHETIAFRRFSEHREIFALRATSRVTPQSVIMQDFNYRAPMVDLTASRTVEGGFGGGVAEYGAHYKTTAEGETMARLRAEEIRAHQLIYEGESSLPALFGGLSIELTDHPDLADEKLLITSVVHEARQNAMGRGTAEPQQYRNHFTAIPSDRPFRPLRLTPRPKMTGFYTGLIQPNDMHVVGPSAELDDEGRYRVRMLFDIKPRDGWVSRPVRMAQPHSGTGHGMHFPLRPGVEVAIVFANGDPDRPIILGALDNPVTSSPTVSKNSRQNILSTASGITITLRDNR